jgi:predicted RNA-binding protein YlqC (UPF0109 family)
MDQRNTDIRLMLEEIVRSLVDAPESVSVQDIPTTNGTLLRLRVAPADITKIIGRQGRTARSLRTILATFSARFDHRYTLDIVEDD